MMKVKLSDFLSSVSSIAAERPAYQLGEDGDNGKCDCIGLIIGAIRRSGGTWSGTHGTNYTARNAVDYLSRFSSADELTVGDLVFKAREIGESGYDLPSRYSGHADLRDYYHVGVVTSVSPLIITHCTSPGGIKEDSKLGQWKYHAWCSKVSAAAPVRMIVTAPSGKTVNLRTRPSLRAPLVRRLPLGTAVNVLVSGSEWAYIAYNTTRGYIMSRYLRKEDI